MFGYVKPFQPELKVCELEVYKSIYCGLCRQMGKRYSQLSRMALSYDMTFLALFAMALSDEPLSFGRRRCPVHPLQKRPSLAGCSALSFAADAGMLLGYYSLRDHIADSRGLKKLLFLPALPVMAHARKKAERTRPEIARIVEKMVAAQEKAEAAKTASIDRASDPSAAALGELAQTLLPDKKLQPALYRAGYMLGRSIYLLDAADDLQKDLQKGCFNPLINRFHIDSPEQADGAEIRQFVSEELNLAFAQLAAAYELLPVKRYKPILDNIIYLGLRAAQKRVLQNQQGEQHEQSV